MKEHHSLFSKTPVTEVLGGGGGGGRQKPQMAETIRI